MTMTESMIHDLAKSEYSHLKSCYFNSAYFGPSPLRAKETIHEAMGRELDPTFYLYDEWMGISERLRISFAKLLGIEAHSVAHFCSSSDVVNTVARGFPFSNDNSDRVCAINKDYPSNVLPWMLLAKEGKIQFDLIDLEAEMIIPTASWIEKKLHPNTKIFNISHVTFDTGKKIDIVSIGKMLKEKNIFFVVDATQSLGGMNLTQEELSYIDVLAVSSYKWMLGPYGHAFGVFNKKALELISHTHANWILSPKSKVVYNLLDYSVETLTGARKFDRGQAANLLVSGCLTGSLDFLNEIGLDAIQKHNRGLVEYFLANYPERDYQLLVPKELNLSNIVCLKKKTGDSLKVEAELKRRNVDISVRQGNLRLSFHIFNNKSQVDELLSALS